MKCPECGETKDLEILRTYTLTNPHKIEVFCNVCSKISIIES